MPVVPSVHFLRLVLAQGAGLQFFALPAALTRPTPDAYADSLPSTILPDHADCSALMRLQGNSTVAFLVLAAESRLTRVTAALAAPGYAKRVLS